MISSRVSIFAITVLFIALAGLAILQREQYQSYDELQKQVRDLQAENLQLRGRPEYVYRSAVHLMEDGELQKASEEFQTFIREFPNSEFVGPARERLQEIQKKMAAADTSTPDQSTNDDELAKRALAGDEQAADELLAKAGVRFEDSDLGGGWTKRTMMRNGQSTGMVSLHSPQPKISTSDYRLVVSCSSEMSPVIHIAQQHGRERLGESDSHVFVNIVVTHPRGDTETSGGFWRTSDGTDLYYVGNTLSLADLIVHVDQFGFSVRNQAAIWNTKGINTADLNECGLHEGRLGL